MLRRLPAHDIVGGKDYAAADGFGLSEYTARSRALRLQAVAVAADGLGLSYRTAHRGLHALSSMVLGFAQEPFSTSQGDPSMEGVEMTDDLVAQFAEQFPYTSAMVAAELHADGDPTLGWCDSQTEFEFTLGLLLDGLEQAAKTGE